MSRALLEKSLDRRFREDRGERDAERFFRDRGGRESYNPGRGFARPARWANHLTHAA